MSNSGLDLTGLLRAWSAGDPVAADELVPLVYAELRRQASRYLARERSGHTLQPTALVNEAYMRLAEQRRVQWHDRGQFFAVAATVMRRVLVDHARQHGASKRGARFTISLDDGEIVAIAPAPDVDVLALNDALTELAEIDPVRTRLIELRFFAGLTTDETAEALGVSPATVTRSWRLARAWLHARLTGEAAAIEERRQGV
ncbi:MAG TPA: sigma-70 family RNA polymerase sigma factor, partial [Vicinamibacterales bacterium]|nr:sigma-70 family RNA polymerase sigma factor [Vicinamibacterales bacterium]